MSAHSLGQALTLPLFHQILIHPELWETTEHGREIQLRTADGPLPAWDTLSSVRKIIFPMVGNLEIVRVGAVFVIEIDPGKELELGGAEPELWYEAVLVATPDVTSEFKDDRQALPPGSLWMWWTPMVRRNLSEYKSMSLIMQLDAA